MAQRMKELMLAELERRFRGMNQTGCVLVDSQSVKGDQARQVRQLMRQRGAEMTAVKNSLCAIALERAGAGGLRELLKGSIAVVQAQTCVDAAKAVQEAARMCEALQVRGAYMDGTVIDADGVRRLAAIPPREELLSMIAGALLAPLRRLACDLLAKPRALLCALEQVRDKAGEQAAEVNRGAALGN